PFAEYGRDNARRAAGQDDAYWDAQAAQPAAVPPGSVPGQAASAGVYPSAPGYDDAYRQAYEVQPQPYQYTHDMPPAYAAYAQAEGGAGAPDFLSQPAYDQQPYDEEAPHEDGTVQRRRKVVLVASAVALVVVGTAAAFGYR